jgi:hypothetical protein
VFSLFQGVATRYEGSIENSHVTRSSDLLLVTTPNRIPVFGVEG